MTPPPPAMIPQPTAGALIRLRRPPVLHAQPEPFVPVLTEAERVEAEARWHALCHANPRYFDGRLWHVLGVHRNGHGGASIHVAECAYRFYAVQSTWRDLAVRLLGVKALATHRGRVLVGLRSSSVAQYGGMWEFAPGGVMEPTADPAAVIKQELREETGFECHATPVAIGLVRDDTARSWEIVYRMELRSIETNHWRTDEYEAIEWRMPHDLPTPLSPASILMRRLLTPSEGGGT